MNSIRQAARHIEGADRKLRVTLAFGIVALGYALVIACAWHGAGASVFA